VRVLYYICGVHRGRVIDRRAVYCDSPPRGMKLTAGLEDVLNMQHHDESWVICPGIDTEGILVMDVTPTEGCAYVDKVLPYVNVAAAVVGSGTPLQGCAGWFTAAVVAVDATHVGSGGIPHGRVATWEAAFGRPTEVDFVHPWVRKSSTLGLLAQRSMAVGAGRPQNVCCAGIDGEGVLPCGRAYRWVACVVYSLEGCSSATLHVQAGVCSVPLVRVEEESPRSRWATVGLWHGVSTFVSTWWYNLRF
jgi:hypothetical protein